MHSDQPKALRSPRDIRIAQALFVILALEGLATLAATLASPSMERRALLLGFSAPRLLLQAGLAAVVFSLLFAAIKGLVDRSWLHPGFVAFETHVANHPVRLATLLAALVSASVLAWYVLALFAASLATNAPGLAKISMTHFSSTIVWLSVIPLEIGLAVALLYPAKLPAAVERIAADPRPLLSVLVLSAGGLQCVTLLLRADWLFQIPGWFWQVTPKRFQLSHLLFFPFAVLALLAIRRLVSFSGRPLTKLMLSVGLLFCLQLAFGAAAGRGFESLRTNFSGRGMSREVRVACEYPGGATPAIRNYETDFADDFWLGTKPPGLLATLIVLRDFTQSTSLQSLMGIDQCFAAVTKVMAFLFPLLASLVVIPLWYLERLLGQRDQPHDSSVLYASVPAVLLMPLIRDQAIYPLLAALTLLVSARATLSRSAPLALIAGSLLYFSAFMSFSLLPVAAIAFAFPVVLGLLSRQPRKAGQLAAIVAAMICGGALAWIVGQTLFGYDPVARYNAAMQLHRTIKGVQTDFPSLRQYALLNSVEFTMAGGAPLILLFLLSAGLALRRILRGLASRREAFVCAVLCSILVLYLAGQTRGEVARLWLYLFVPISLIAAPTARALVQPPGRGFLLFCSMQLFIAWLTFMNMDFG